MDEPGCLKQGVDAGKPHPPDAGTPGDGFVPGGDLPSSVEGGQRSRLTLSGGCGCGVTGEGGGQAALVVLLLLALRRRG